MTTYLALNVPEDWEHASAHVRWLRGEAAEIRALDPIKAAKLDEDARQLEEAILQNKIL